METFVEQWIDAQTVGLTEQLNTYQAKHPTSRLVAVMLVDASRNTYEALWATKAEQ